MLASRRVVIGPPGLGTSTGRAALRPTPDNSEMTATPTTMLMMAVKTLLASGAGWVNGAAAAITSARAVIQAKNAKGRGVPSSSRCSSAVARSVAPAARSAYTAVAEFPKRLDRIRPDIVIVFDHQDGLVGAPFGDGLDLLLLRLHRAA